MKIALGQMEVIPGEPEKNVAKMIDMMEEASKQADLICFGEMCVGGYLVGDLWLDDAWCKDLMTYNAEIANAAKTFNIAVTYGNVYLSDKYRGKDGRDARFNAAYVFDRNGQPATRKKYICNCCSCCKCEESSNIFPDGVQIKTNLPNYRFFDDQRYFYSATDVSARLNEPISYMTTPFILDGLRIGVCLCEDLWCEDYVKYNQTINPARFYAQNGANIILNLSASPWTHGKDIARDRRVASVMSDVKDIDFYGYVNCVGVQNNGKNVLTFDGGSTFYGKNGIIKTHKSSYLQDIIYLDTKSDNEHIIYRKQADVINEKRKAIIEAIKSFVPNNMKVLIGLSGGIDSAVVTALCTLALGKERIIAVNMPSEYNSDTTKYAALMLAKNLRIKYEVIPIENLINANRDALEPAKKLLQIDSITKSLVEENIQSKIRGTNILSNLAQMSNALFVNCSNKIEIAIGYATLYGDVSGSICPIGDLTKTEVYAMARFINEEYNKLKPQLNPSSYFQLIPQISIDIEPSAELKDNQKDPIKVGYHCSLIKMMTNYKITNAENIMEWWLNGTLADNLNITDKMLEKFGLFDADVFLKDLKWFFNRERGSVFKRIQSPPIVVTSKTAYGYDRRESIMPKYKWTRAARDLATRIREQKTYK